MARRGSDTEGKWERAVSPLQRARHDRRWQQATACRAIRLACPGHAGEACKLEPSKLSEYEHGRRKPSLVHIEAMCAVYQRSPEELGLINWRRIPQPQTAEPAPEPGEPARPADVVPAMGERGPAAGEDFSTGSSRTFGVYSDSDLESLVLMLRGDDLTPLDEREAEGSAVQRKTFLKGVGAVAGAAATDPIIRLTQMDRAALAATTVSKATLDALEQAAYLHARGYCELHLPGRAQGLLTDWANAGRLLHTSQTPSQRIRLSESYARLGGILAMYLLDNGQHRRGVALFTSAEEAAHEAGSNDLLAWLYERHAEVFNYYGGNPREQIAVVERGLEAAGRAETLTVGRLHGMAAVAYASIGDPRWSAAHQREAERILDKGVTGCWPSDRSMPRGFSFTTDALASGTARSHARLGDYAKAADFYRESIAKRLAFGLTASTATALPLDQLQLAGALVHLGELDEATHTIRTVIQEHKGVAKPLILRQARAFAADLAATDSSGTYARSFGEFLREHTPPRSQT